MYDKKLVSSRGEALTLLQVGWDPWSGKVPLRSEVLALLREDSPQREPSDFARSYDFLQDQVRAYMKYWRWAQDRAQHRSNWDKLALMLLTGERDERRLLDCITLSGAGGEEVLLAIQAIEAYDRLEGHAMTYYRSGFGSDPHRRHWWWSPNGEWLPHLGGPDYAETWGQFREWLAEGGFRAAKDLLRYFSNRSNFPDSLSRAWDEEVRRRMAPYLAEAEARFDRTPWSLNLPTDRADWISKLLQADQLFLQVLTPARERAEREGSNWRAADYPLNKVFDAEAVLRARAMALSVWSEWSPLFVSGPYGDLRFWLVFSGEGDPPSEGVLVPPFQERLLEDDAPVPPLLGPAPIRPTDRKDWSPAVGDVHLTVGLLRGGGHWEWSREVLKRWG